MRDRLTGLWFGKYEGLGNDLIFLDGRPDSMLPRIVEERRDWLQRLCDRHFGVGADGVICVEPAIDSAAGAVASYWNSDGSPAGMCGNGLRCAALFLHHAGRAPLGVHFSVEMTGSGAHDCVVIETKGRSGIVEVEMGYPRMGEGAEGTPDRLRIGVGGREVEVVPLAIGNPHAVIFGAMPRSEMEAVGPALEHDRLFPDRVNVEFATVRSPSSMDLVVWERGCGFTQACGSGACAAVAAAVREGYCDPDRPIEVRMPGGSLEVILESRTGAVRLRGPACKVFEGRMEP